MFKRLFDLMIALPLLILLAPLFVLIGVAIRVETAGSAFWASQRVGKDGKIFWLYGFRTMYMTPDRPQQFTRVGTWIRNRSLDHLPFLLNIVRGEMSIVGPRPPEVYAVDQHDPLWQEVLRVRPGLVSWAILNLATAYNLSDWETRNRYEAQYARQASLWFDLRVLALGLLALFQSGGNVKMRGTPRSGAQQ